MTHRMRQTRRIATLVLSTWLAIKGQPLFRVFGLMGLILNHEDVRHMSSFDKVYVTRIGGVPLLALAVIWGFTLRGGFADYRLDGLQRPDGINRRFLYSHRDKIAPDGHAC